MIDLAQMALGLIIGWRCLLALNCMTGQTHHGIRMVYLVLGTASAAMVLTPLYPESAAQVPKLVALAAYLALQVADRRKDAHESVAQLHVARTDQQRHGRRERNGERPAA